MPDTFETNIIDTNNLIEIHEIVKQKGQALCRHIFL